jgi:hypothetical protein
LLPADHSSRYRRLTGVNEWGFPALPTTSATPSGAGIRNRSVAGEAKKPRPIKAEAAINKT